MASPKKLPSDEVLRRHVEDGLTNREIAAKYGVTPEAVRQRLAKMGIRRTPERADHSHYLPWRLRGDHFGDLLARRLRAYSNRQQGRPLPLDIEKKLDAWLKWMDGDNPWSLPMSVHYDRLDDEGFWLEPRAPGDRDYISPPPEGGLRLEVI